MNFSSCYPTLNPSQILQNEAFHNYHLTLEIIIKELICSALNLAVKQGWLNNTKTSEPPQNNVHPWIIISQEEANKCGLDMIGSFPKLKKIVSKNGFSCPNHTSILLVGPLQPMFTLSISPRHLLGEE
ncbi:hypothetical protein TNCV_2188961 [Trichonephila clavipes]|nr:hypothetical protein TNCV_2188961 [Trichonephila clavipes]